jgi:hypothetical protein
LINAMRVLDSQIQSDDGVANAVIAEAAQRLEEQQERIKRLESWIDSLEVLEQHSGKLPEREWFGSEIGYLRKGQAVYKGEAKP